MNDAYQNCLTKMYGLRRFGIKLGLDTIRRILNGIHNPHHHFSSIHIAGTNGKGSVASNLSTILQLAGYRVGLYTSPHLVKFNERICINNRPISDDQVVDAYNAVAHIDHGPREATFFEYTTAMAFFAFHQQKVDWAIIETGMGGRLDATNVVDSVLAIITNIALEHQTYLGSTLSEIAGEKGGIIKEKTPVITGVRQKTVINTLEQIARLKSAPLYRLGRDFKVRRTGVNTFSYFGIQNVFRKMETSLMGSYQVDNASLVLAACEILNTIIQKNQGTSFITPENIYQGLRENKWPGRLEVVSTSPLILLDGAHNLAAASNLAHYLEQNFQNRKITLIIGILDDKPYAEILAALIPLSHKVILTQSQSDRTLPTNVLYQVTRLFSQNIIMRPTVRDAITYAVDHAAKEDVICIAGSLYVVGEAKAYLQMSNDEVST